MISKSIVIKKIACESRKNSFFVKPIEGMERKLSYWLAYGDLLFWVIMAVLAFLSKETLEASMISCVVPETEMNIFKSFAVE